MTDMNFILPGQLVELLEDVVIENIHERGYYWFKIAAGLPYNSQGQPVVPYTIPAGTVIKVVNYKANSFDNHISLWIMWSPDKNLLPKSRGGTGKRTNFWPRITEVVKQNWKVKVVP